MVSYIKTREAKIDFLEKKMRGQNAELSSLKQQQDTLLQEYELTGQSFEEAF